MTFLSPLTAIAAGAVGATALLLLYVLRLRRRVVRIPSTMFWPGVREDLEVNTPFRRLRMTPLLLLQMLAVLLLAAALGEPVIDAGPEPSGRTIIMVDRSASMRAPADAGSPSGPSRLEVAIEAARVEIDRRTAGRGGREPGEVMLIAFDARPQVVRGFERRPGPLLDALRTIGPTDGEADLEAAMQLASAFVVSGEETGEEPPEVLLLSDGGTAPPRRTGPTLLARAILDVRSPVVGASVEPDDGGDAAIALGIRNVGFVAATARRDDLEPAIARLFARLANAGPESVVARVVIDRDGEPVATEDVVIPAATPGGPVGEATLARDIEAADPALLRLTITRQGPGRGAAGASDAAGETAADGGVGPDPGAGGEGAADPEAGPRPDADDRTAGRRALDQLAADDVAAIRLPPAASPRIAIVAPDARPLASLAALLDATGPSDLRRLDPASWRRLVESEQIREIDLVVFDRAAGPALPPVPSLWFGAMPPGIARVSDLPPVGESDEAGEAGEAGGADGADDRGDADPDADAAPEAATAFDPDRGRRVLSWRRTHPALRYVALDEVAFAGFDAFREPPRSEVLARGADGPVMIEVPAAGARHVLVGFALDRTNWVTDVGFAVFVQNVIGELAATGRGQVGQAARPGDPVRVRLRPDVAAGDEVRVEGPVSFTLTADGGPSLLVPGLPLVGTYAIRGALPPDDLLAVNLASVVETDLRPRPVESVRARETRTGVASADSPRDLWPWFVAAAGVLAMVEWLAYVRLVRG